MKISPIIWFPNRGLGTKQKTEQIPALKLKVEKRKRDKKTRNLVSWISRFPNKVWKPEGTPPFLSSASGDERGVKFVRPSKSIFIFLIALTLFIHAQETPKRIISLAPNVTEMIFKLGAQDRLVGRTEFCLYPEAAKKIPSVGGYLNPDYEKIVDLQPDMIFMFPNEDMEHKLQGFGIEVISIPDETIGEVLSGIKTVGKAIGLEQRGDEIVGGIRDTLDLVGRAGTDFDSISALLVVGREQGSLKGLYAAGRNTYLGEIWKLCGGRNVFEDISIRYFSVSKEDLINRNPDCILEFRIMPDVDIKRQVTLLKSHWEELPVLNAVKEDRIYIFTDRYFLIPGPRISKIAVSFSKIVDQVVHVQN